MNAAGLIQEEQQEEKQCPREKEAEQDIASAQKPPVNETPREKDDERDDKPDQLFEKERVRRGRVHTAGVLIDDCGDSLIFLARDRGILFEGIHRNESGCNDGNESEKENPIDEAGSGGRRDVFGEVHTE